MCPADHEAEVARSGGRHEPGVGGTRQGLDDGSGFLPGLGKRPAEGLAERRQVDGDTIRPLSNV